MLEIIALGSGADPNSVPWSGPGSKKLIKGNKEAGYFGTVSKDELFTYADINALVKSTTKVVGVQIPVWHKFILNNSRVFYVPFNYLIGSIGWKDLYNSGLIYGKRGPGRAPLPPGMTEVDQLTMLIKPEIIKGVTKNWPMMVRTMHGTSVDPYTDLAMVSDEALEFNKLLNGTYGNTSHGTAYVVMQERSSNALMSHRRDMANFATSYAQDTIGH